MPVHVLEATENTMLLDPPTGEGSTKNTMLVGPSARSRAGKGRKARCEDCYFRCNLLCALPQDAACATFRPNHPDGLRPPRQLRFHFRQPGRTTAAWAFPTAEEQAALHR